MKPSTATLSTAPGPTFDLVCPRCKQLLRWEGALWSCPSCGQRARRTMGFIDFLYDVARLPVADDSIDLQADVAMAGRMATIYDESDFSDLHRYLEELRTEGRPVDMKLHRAQTRFETTYARVAEEVGLEHGRAILWKVDAHLESRGLSPLGGGRALEGAGGHGMFLPRFAETFDEVVFLDCLLVHLLLARKLADEQGLSNVSFVRADVTELPFATHTFDFIHENGVIEHVAEPEKMIREALRIRNPSGTYVCLSPNRFSIAPEPHFRLPAFGSIPKPLRRLLLPGVRGLRSEAGTDLRSLRQLRRYFAAAGEGRVLIFFLPPSLPATARSTGVRRFVQRTLRSSVGGQVLGWILNRLLLPVMPYHIAVVSGARVRLEGSPRTPHM